jgi:hypothetical protein
MPDVYDFYSSSSGNKMLMPHPRSVFQPQHTSQLEDRYLSSSVLGAATVAGIGSRGPKEHKHRKLKMFTNFSVFNKPSI